MDGAVAAQLRSDNPTDGTTLSKVELQPRQILDDKELEKFKEVLAKDPPIHGSVLPPQEIQGDTGAYRRRDGVISYSGLGG